MKQVAVRIVSGLKVWRNHVNVTRKPMPMAHPQILQTPTPTPSPTLVGGNPCLDLFFNVVKQDSPAEAEANGNYLKQLLPLAWSHNPLTTLKLICNLLDRRGTAGKGYDDGFHTAAFWLHHHHPKTLASNVASIAASFGSLDDLVVTLYWILAGQEVRRRSQNSTDDDDDDQFEEKMINIANKAAVERYKHDPDYHLLHDSVSDLFAQCLTSDIQNLKKRMWMGNCNNIDDLESKWLEITLAASDCDDRATLLCESIARKVFPYDQGAEEEEEDYLRKVRERVRKEVLEPLRKALDCEISGPNESNKWGYKPKFEQEACVAKEYLEDLKAGGSGCKSKIAAANALVPNQIIPYVDDEDVGQVTELLWKAMMEDVYLKQDKLKNCLAVFGIRGRRTGLPGDVSVALTLMMSQLSEEPWKGKVVSFSLNPRLHSIQGQDLKSKCEFVRRMECREWEIDFHKVFDLILKAAVNGNLKPEQMIKKVVVFTNSYQSFEETSASGGCWESDYGAIHSKFKDKGYGDVVPHLVLWHVNEDMHSLMYPTPSQQGVRMLSGFDNNLVKFFLDNDGEIGPNHVMEAAIAGEKYTNLVVVD